MFVGLLFVAGLTAAAHSRATEAPTAPEPSGPRLVLSQDEIDLGRVDPRRETKRVLDIDIRNGGDGPLEIRKIRTTCPCLTAQLPTRAVAPGASTRLSLEIVPSPFDEAIEEAALIYSNDATTPLAKLRVIGHLSSAIRVVPEGIAVGVVPRSAVAGRRLPGVRLTSLDGKALGPVRTSTSHPAIGATDIALEDGAHEIQVTVGSGIPLGPLNHAVTVTTSHPDVPTLDIPVVGMLLGNLDPQGRRLDFGLLRERHPGAVTFALANRSDRQVRILRVEPRLPVAADVEAIADGKDFKIVVRIDGAPAFTSLGGDILLHTDDPDEPVVRLEVFGSVLAERPFAQAATDGTDDRLFAVVLDALSRGERIPAEQFFTDVLGGVRDERAVGLLLAALDRGEALARMRAVELLGDFPTPEVRARIRTAATDDALEFVRRRAVAAHVAFEGRAAVPLVLLALQDDDAWVREDAANHLARLGEPAAIPALRAAMSDPDPDAAAAIRSALVALQGRTR